MRTNVRRGTVEVREATPNNVEECLCWLREEYENDGEGFYCNRPIIERVFEDVGVMVATVDGKDPVGLLVGERRSWNEIDIVTVRKNTRGRGVGKALVQEYINRALDSGSLGIWGECQPPTSEPFWAAMGFELIPPSFAGYTTTAQTLRRALCLDRPGTWKDGKGDALVQVSFTRDWDDIPLEAPIETGARRTSRGWALEKHVLKCIPDPDVAIRVAIDGSVVFRDKVKRASPVGMERVPPFVRLCTVTDPR